MASQPESTMSSHDSVWQASLEDFCHAIEARSMPGCGAAAAVSAGIGLALVLKGLRLGEETAEAPGRSALIARGNALRQRLAHLADDDIAGFEAYLAAQRLPHRTPGQARQRDEARQQALLAACRVPLQIARGCCDGLALGSEALAHTAAALQSDTRAGLQLLAAAFDAVLVGLDDNLPGLADSQQRADLAEERDRLRQEAERRRP
ncbi:cyclodeaminase/cyclohydrolase family protein [Halomonas sp. E19]|uniref:cyclodeaminase/cyclohydrolase family protein n=1 Tax=unclassified Halomonas TaxID=2609666 RepID=UPI004033D8AD